MYVKTPVKSGTILGVSDRIITDILGFPPNMPPFTKFKKYTKKDGCYWRFNMVDSKGKVHTCSIWDYVGSQVLYITSGPTEIFESLFGHHFEPFKVETTKK